MMGLSKLNSFLRNTSGNTAMIFSLAAVPLLLGAGVAIDSMRATAARTDLQAAADAAAIAGASSNKTNNAALKKIVDDFLIANDAEHTLSAVKSIKQKLDPVTRTFTVNIEGKMETSFMFLAGVSEIDIGAKAEVALGGSALEVVLALDNTASMNSGGRMDALKAAAKNLVADVLALQTTGAYVRVGIVPFGNYVNVGTSRRNAPWINVPADSTTTQNVCNTTYPNASSSNCRQEVVTYNNDGVPTTYNTTVCDWVYGNPVTTCADQTWNNTWNGCVGSRPNPYDEQLGSTNVHQYPGMQNTSCPSEITQLGGSVPALETQIDAMIGTGNTYIPQGILWGWNMLQAGGPIGAAKTKAWMKTRGGTKALVLMTDGANTVSADNQYHWGSDVNKANAKTTALCNGVKGDDIVVYTVGFMVDDTTAQNILKDCASDPSKAYNADNANALAEAFDAIAGSLTATRFTK
jgi:Putative Flp pilus-assembly TadE/G-like